jgi:PKD domain/Kelch motif
MPKFLKLAALVISLAGVLYVSCSKEFSCESCNIKLNQPPVASAGRDTTYILPIDSIILNGTASYDPDGTITQYAWTKILGPDPVNLSSYSASKAIWKNPAAGKYSFQLKVTDNSGLSGLDTIVITINNSGNQPPIARAGADTIIDFPVNTAILDGSASTDPDNNITAYAWKNISGPTGFTISNSQSAKTNVTNLAVGVYLFELTVTDGGGLSSKDTVMISVVSGCQMTPAALTQIGNLSIARYNMVVASAANKIIFAGGNGELVISTRVDIYDITTGTWTTAELSAPREYMTAVSSGNKIFIAGGYENGSQIISSRVDIYDAGTNTWTTAELSQPRVFIAAAAAGNKVVFAGGYINDNSDRVDIYDMSTDTWSTASLSQGRSSLSAVSDGEKIYFAGGEARGVGGTGFGGSDMVNTIDIYNSKTNSWSTSSMDQKKANMPGIYADGKIFWCGGTAYITNNNYVGSNNIEILDLSSNQTSYISPLCENIDGSDDRAVRSNNDILFFEGYDPPYQSVFLHYNLGTGILSSGLVKPGLTNFAVISVNNTIYLAGGFDNSISTDKVWTMKY